MWSVPAGSDGKESACNAGDLSWIPGLGTFPGGSDGKESACNAEDPGLILGLGRFLGEGNGSPLQYSCLENSLDRETWLATDHGATKNRTGLSD